MSILETYFECEEGDDQNLAPQMAGNQYAFGQQAAQVSTGVMRVWWACCLGPTLPAGIPQKVGGRCAFLTSDGIL